MTFSVLTFPSEEGQSLSVAGYFKVLGIPDARSRSMNRGWESGSRADYRGDVAPAHGLVPNGPGKPDRNMSGLAY